jgi:hypothetical protein
MKFIEIIIKKWITQKIALGITALTTFLFPVAIVYKDFLLKYFEDPTGSLGLITSTLSVACILIALAIYFWYKPKLVYSLKDGGCWLDEKSNIRYCISCKIIHKELAPLTPFKTNEQSGWSCKVAGCHKSYYHE